MDAQSCACAAGSEETATGSLPVVALAVAEEEAEGRCPFSGASGSEPATAETCG